MSALAFLWLATLTVLPARFCVRGGWSLSRVMRAWLVSAAFAAAGALPALVLTTSGFAVASPLWMLAGGGVGALVGLGVVERAGGFGFGPARAFAFGAIGFAIAAALVLASAAVLEPGAGLLFAMALALVTPTTFAYSLGKPLTR
jgi:hypothetical protein